MVGWDYRRPWDLLVICLLNRRPCVCSVCVPNQA